MNKGHEEKYPRNGYGYTEIDIMERERIINSYSIFNFDFTQNIQIDGI